MIWLARKFRLRNESEAGSIDKQIFFFKLVGGSVLKGFEIIKKVKAKVF